jgi:carbamoyltransferase
VRKETGAKNICLAGGVALNCVANGKLLRENLFDGIWVQPAAGDAGGAVGAAYAAYHGYLGQGRKLNGHLDGMAGSYLGPEYSDDEIEKRLVAAGGKLTRLTRDQIIEQTAQALADEKAVGWMQGRMEFGPRSLGARSILGDARSPSMQKTLNLKVKYRESFRPFAPAVLREDVDKYFDIKSDSPYMLMVAPVNEDRRRAMNEAEQALFGIDKLNVPRSDIPAVTHVDYSARIQTVHKETNPAFHDLLSAFKAKTGYSVVVNTSFNVRGEPIVCTPEDAFRCFMGSEIEVLVVGNCFLRKEDQDPALKLDYKNAFELD